MTPKPEQAIGLEAHRHIGNSVSHRCGYLTTHVLAACVAVGLGYAAAVSGQATLEMVFDEDLFSQTPPGNFYPLMHGTTAVYFGLVPSPRGSLP